MTTFMESECSVCRAATRTPVERVRLVDLVSGQRIRYECDDCGDVYREVDFLHLARLMAAGMPPSLDASDVETFQISMLAAEAGVGIATLAGQEVSR